MMAKMFYTLDEVKAALGKNDEEIKQLVREARLREFRDGPRLMFKTDQVEQLKAELGAGGTASGLDKVDLGPSDSGAPIGLVDSRNASGSVISLTDTDASGGTQFKEDTASGMDLGLSGSLGGIPSPGKGTGSGLSNTGGSGVTVFRPDEVERVDPMAQTAMSASLQDQVNLEGVGSGSGLLDLTRESDDTSLGAELLDEISTGGGAPRRPTVVSSGESRTGTNVDMSAISSGGGGRVITAPTYVEAPDNMAPALAGASLGAAIMVIFGGFITTGAVLGYYPSILQSAAGNGVWALFGIGLVLAVILFVIGLIVGKAAGK